MRLFAILSCAAAVIVACGKGDSKADSAAAAPAAMTPPPPKPIALADVAGKWNVKGMNETGDSTLATYVLVATADTTGWTITFPNRKAIPVRVGPVAGDSIVIDAGPYESVLRRGMQVTTHGALRLQNGMLVGMSTAHYKTTKPDSVRRVKTEGMRAP
jgi:hypothetical protein